MNNKAFMIQTMACATSTFYLFRSLDLLEIVTFDGFRSTLIFYNLDPYLNLDPKIYFLTTFPSTVEHL